MEERIFGDSYSAILTDITPMSSFLTGTKTECLALTSVAQWVGYCLAKQKASSSISLSGHMPGL